MLISLQQSFKFMIESIFIVLLFSGFFALITLHLFSGKVIIKVTYLGMLKYQCFDLELGLIDEIYCGYNACPDGFACSKIGKNPDLPTNLYHFE